MSKEGDEKKLDICEPCRRRNDPQGRVCSADRAPIEYHVLISRFLDILTSSRQRDFRDPINPEDGINTKK